MQSVDEIYKKIELVPDFLGHKISSVNYKNSYGDTPLHIVSGWGDCESIETLTSKGGDINAIGETGFTPLHCAAEQNKSEAVKLLIKLGALSIPNANNETPLELALSLGCIEAIRAFNTHT